ncbi:hypothetical protein WJX72_001768 [[Myrmecia] bisecta]|uniref:NADH dehydrogenase [ubiquinone] 1 beta subcomplex subunit 1 n=1 Tax=[Myrmecia] bisecta TaxID=41462 RepID=A0AAW1P880_9CHLO
MDMFSNPYRGDASIPHVKEDFFKMYFVGAQVGLALMLLPGRVLGSEVRPRRWNRDYVIACCDEAARKREALRGKRIPRHFMHAPKPTTHSWEKMWWNHLHWKRWTQERMGGGHIKAV